MVGVLGPWDTMAPRWCLAGALLVAAFFLPRLLLCLCLTLAAATLITRRVSHLPAVSLPAPGEACQGAVAPQLLHQRQPLFVGVAGAQVGHQVLVSGAPQEVERRCHSFGLPASLQGAWVRTQLAQQRHRTQWQRSRHLAGHTGIPPWI